MIGEVVASRPTGRVAAILFFLLGLVLLFAALAGRNPHPAILAILPSALGIAALLSADAPIAFTITELGLEFEEPNRMLIRYDDLRGLTAPVSRSRGGNFAMQLYHTGGVVRLPDCLGVSSVDLYKFLLDRLPDLDAPEADTVPLSLRGFVSEQLELFGEDKVYVFHARQFAPLPSHSRAVGYSLAALGATVVWVIVGLALGAGNKQDGGVWVGFGCLLFFIALLFTFIFARASKRGRAGNWRESCLVVSPSGIALVQGTLRGKMRWDELRAIEYPAKPRIALASHGGARSGIGLLVEGAYFIIGDYYVRPLSRIHATLRAYWGDQKGN